MIKHNDENVPSQWAFSALSMRRNHVSTVIRSHFYVMCPPGIRLFSRCFSLMFYILAETLMKEINRLI